VRVSDCAVTNHHDPVKLLRATVHSKKAIKKKEAASVAVSYGLDFDSVVLAG